MTTPSKQSTSTSSTSELLSQLQTKISMPSLTQNIQSTTQSSTATQLSTDTTNIQSTTKVKIETQILSTRKHIGVVTSGGDAPGMNAALMAIVRYSLTKGIEVYAIHEGYYGMAKGGKYFKKFTWEDTRGICEKV